jgi:hypothetical protein
MTKHSLIVTAPTTTTELPIPPITLYEILESFIENNKDELILKIQKVKSLNAVRCFISSDDSDEHERLSLNFLLRNDDSIEVTNEENDDEEGEATDVEEDHLPY